jgi:hypothetical protein
MLKTAKIAVFGLNIGVNWKLKAPEKWALACDLGNAFME